MKFKGFIPPGYELVNGRERKYLRKKPESRMVNRTLTKNSRNLPEVSKIGSQVLKAISPDRRYLRDSKLSKRFNSKMMLGAHGPQKWWTRDWMKGFEVHASYPLDWLVSFDSTYTFTPKGCSVRVENIAMEECTSKKRREFMDMNLKMVLVFVDEAKKRFHRFESKLMLVKRKVRSAVLKVSFDKRPPLPYLIFIYGNGVMNDKPMELIEATGMMVVGSGVESPKARKRSLK
jgi:hypothetical protein